MPSGRPKGKKNKAGHSAGGARAGSGRRRQDNNSQAAGMVQGRLLFLLMTIINP